MACLVLWVFGVFVRIAIFSLLSKHYSYRRTLEICILILIMPFRFLVHCYIVLTFSNNSERKVQWLISSTHETLGWIMVILFEIANTDCLKELHEVTQTHKEDAVFLVMNLHLLFQLWSPLLTRIRPVTIPFLLSPRISQFD